MPIGGAGSGGMESLKAACDKRGRDVKDLTIALFGAPADADNVKGRLDQGFTEIIFGLPQSEPDKVLAQLDKIAAVVEQVR